MTIQQKRPDKSQENTLKQVFDFIGDVSVTTFTIGVTVKAMALCPPSIPVLSSFIGRTGGQFIRRYWDGSMSEPDKQAVRTTVKVIKGIQGVESLVDLTRK